MLTGSRRPPFYLHARERLASHTRLRSLQKTGALIHSLDGVLDLRPFYRRLQQVGNTCLGFSRTQNVRTFCASRGIAAPLIDPYFPYWFGRKRYRMQKADGGAYTEGVWWSGRQFGDVEWDPATPAPNLLKPPSGRQVMRAVDLAIDGAQIFDSGDRLVWRIVDSMRKRQSVQLSMGIDLAFFASEGPEVIDVPIDALGLGHAVALLAALPDVDGEPLPMFAIGNSWGHWRDGGIALIKGRYVAQLAYGAFFVRGVTRRAA